MLQDSSSNLETKLASLRQLLTSQKLDGYIIPSCDEFQNEYVPNYLRRLEWLSGFTGSNGVAIVTLDKAVLYTDGRYLLQAKQQLTTDWTILDMGVPESCGCFFACTAGQKLGYDPMLHTVTNLEYYQKLAKRYGFIMCSKSNLIDEIWQRPKPKNKQAVSLPLEYSGQSTEDKLTKVVKMMDQNADHLLITAPDSVSWLLNMRGYAVDYTPVVLCYAMVNRQGKVMLFGEEKIGNKEYTCHPLQSAVTHLAKLIKQGKVVQCDPKQAPAKLGELCQIHQPDPCTILKAVKNQVEQKGMRQAGIIDSIALCRFLHWLETNPEARSTDEIEAAEKLLAFRSNHPLFQMPSFATISAFGSNGAIIHYHATPSTNRKLEGNNLYLVDSGGHYSCGTTDITRVIARGTPSAKQILYYTLVLKGHIALARSIFPTGTSGAQLDALARTPLWQYGANYAHGTGHGVGHYLSVHEGPQRIAASSTANYSLSAGMVLSNEPGYYQEGEYGIRLENLMLVQPTSYPNFLQFDILTWVPFEHRLIDIALLNPEERAWLNQYHERIYELLHRELDTACQQWLTSATKKL